MFLVVYVGLSILTEHDVGIAVGIVARSIAAYCGIDVIVGGSGGGQPIGKFIGTGEIKRMTAKIAVWHIAFIVVAAIAQFEGAVGICTIHDNAFIVGNGSLIEVIGTMCTGTQGVVL